jgi:hypothetical protein
MLPAQVETPDGANAGTEADSLAGNDRQNCKGKKNKKGSCKGKGDKKGNCKGKSNRRSFDCAGRKRRDLLRSG